MEWKDYRIKDGEIVTDESWVMRDLWRTTNVKHGVKGLATCPRKLTYSGVQKVLDRAVWKQGLRREPLPEGVKRYPWKLAHGFRKFYKTQAEHARMNTLCVEKLMGIGLADSYTNPNIY